MISVMNLSASFRSIGNERCQCRTTPPHLPSIKCLTTVRTRARTNTNPASKSNQIPLSSSNRTDGTKMYLFDVAVTVHLACVFASVECQVLGDHFSIDNRRNNARLTPLNS